MPKQRLKSYEVIDDPSQINEDKFKKPILIIDNIDILGDPAAALGKEKLRLYYIKSLQLENLNFLEEVYKTSKLSNKKDQKIALNNIMNSYVINESTSQINLPSEIALTLISHFKKGDLSISHFNLAVEDIASLMVANLPLSVKKECLAANEIGKSFLQILDQLNESIAELSITVGAAKKRSARPGLFGGGDSLHVIGILSESLELAQVAKQDIQKLQENAIKDIQKLQEIAVKAQGKQKSQENADKDPLVQVKADLVSIIDKHQASQTRLAEALKSHRHGGLILAAKDIGSEIATVSSDVEKTQKITKLPPLRR